MSDDRHEVGGLDREEARYIDAARRGDLPAFNWLVLRYQTRVYNLCLRMLSDPDAAADATQETFISAYKAIGRFKGGMFRSWVLRIASNACLDMLRSQRRHPTMSLDSAPPGQDEEEVEPLQVADLDNSVNPEASALNQEVAQAIQDALGALPDDQRIAIVLVDVQGLSYEEAAEITASNLGTIKSRINRARTRLRDTLREMGVVPSGELSARGERSNSET
jgi:RNA polymerase sigma-70 factor (ECF subfamily)